MLNAELEPVLTPNLIVDDTPREKCGIVGVYSPEGGAVQMAYLGIKALQHRGQDGAGFSWIERDERGQPRIEIRKKLGRVAAGFHHGADLQHIEEPESATAFVRYETTEAEDPLDAIHPLHLQALGKEYTLAHNGQFDMDSLFQTAIEHGLEPVGTDTELVAKILGVSINHYGHIEPALHNLLPQLEGAFSLSILTEEGIYGVRDRHGIRPLVIGTNGTARMLASEKCGLKANGKDGTPQLDFEFEQEVAPGTYVCINDQGIREERWATEDKKACIFESVYLSKPDNVQNGISVRHYRSEAGRMLGEQETLTEGVVIPVLGSARVYAKAYAEASGLEYGEVLKLNPDRPNPDSDRTFIEKTQADQEAAVAAKFIINPELIKRIQGEIAVVVDDSLVRGNTTRQIVQMLRDAGAREVHIRIGSNIYSKPCAFGVNVQSEDELLAHGRTVEEMAEAIGADSLVFLERAKMHIAAGVTEDEVCDGCMGGSYPRPRDKDQVSALVA